MHPTRWELSHMVDLQAAANSLVIGDLKLYHP